MDVNGVQDSFLSENQEWAFLNSDYSDGESNEKSSKKVPADFNASYCQSPLPPKVDVATSIGVTRVVLSENNDSGDDKNNEEKGEDDVREPGNHEKHLWTERERRKKMRNMFTNLQALLPQLHHPKVDKSTILDEAVNHIKTLESTLSDLQKQKMERLQSSKTRTILGMADQCGTFASDNATMMMSIPHMTSMSHDVFKTWTSPNMTLNVCGNDAHINICCSKKIGVVAAICSVLEKYKIDVLSAHVSSDHNRSMYMIHARVIGGYECQFPVEEIYKEAAREIIVICG